jgi:hypothetical protein
MKSYQQRKAEFAAKKAELDAEHADKKAALTDSIVATRDGAAAAHQERDARRRRKYQQATAENRAEWQSAKDRFREQQDARKNPTD